MRNPEVTTSTCECGKEFTCHHRWNIGAVWCNHCMLCMKGADGDMCKGKCEGCREKLLDIKEIKSRMGI